MRQGKLLALDTPSMLKNALPGEAWDVFLVNKNGKAGVEKLSPLIEMLNRLEQCTWVSRTGLVSDHLRVITPKGFTSKKLRKKMDEIGIHKSRVVIQEVEPTLEDVFLALAKKN